MKQNHLFIKWKHERNRSEVPEYGQNKDGIPIQSIKKHDHFDVHIAGTHATVFFYWTVKQTLTISILWRPQLINQHLRIMAQSVEMYDNLAGVEKPDNILLYFSTDTHFKSKYNRVFLLNCFIVFSFHLEKCLVLISQLIKVHWSHFIAMQRKWMADERNIMKKHQI